jgi:hypothetical protein
MVWLLQPVSLGKMISKVEGSGTQQVRKKEKYFEFKRSWLYLTNNTATTNTKLNWIYQQIEDSFYKNSISEKINNIFFISGLKTNDGEFKINIPFQDFESIDDEDYVQWTYQKSPCIIGMESNLEDHGQNRQGYL